MNLRAAELRGIKQTASYPLSRCAGEGFEPKARRVRDRSTAIYPLSLSLSPLTRGEGIMDTALPAARYPKAPMIMQRIINATSSREEFREIFFPHIDEIYAAAVRLTQNPAKAEHLAEATFIKAWGAFHLFDRGTNVRVWLYRILAGEFSRYGRDISEESETDIVSWKPRNTSFISDRRDETCVQRQESLVQTIMAKLSNEDILNALRSLPDGLRLTVILADFQSLSPEEIAMSLGLSVENVQSGLNVGRRYFKIALGIKADPSASVAEKSDNSRKSFCLERA